MRGRREKANEEKDGEGEREREVVMRRMEKEGER
jgi:hypothetical protein